MSFTVTLCSDSSKSYYPSNTPSCFKNVVNKKLNFIDNSYEVAVVSVSYVNRFRLFETTNDKLIFANESSYLLNTQGIFNVDELVQEIKKQICTKVDGLDFYFNPNRSITIKYVKGKLKLSSRLAKYLGFNTHKFQNGFHTGEPVHTHLFPQRLYFCTDIIDSQIVGDYQLPVIQTLDNSHPINTLVQKDFSPLYLPVSKELVSCITFSVTDRRGNCLHLTSENLEVTLHFKPCQS